jgi:hypothetical protein
LSSAPPPPLPFSEAIELLAKLTDLGVVLVGGQAVSYWADRYREQDGLLAAGWPYASKDVDVQGGRHVVEVCAQRIGGKALMPTMDHATPMSGVVVFVDHEGYERKVDFLPHVYGLHADEVRRTAIPAQLLGEDGGLLGVDLRIMHPVLCMESRVHNVVGLPGQYDNEHGRAQLTASIRSAQCFVVELLELGEERNARKLCERIFRFCGHQRARRLFREKGVDPFDAVPDDQRFHPDFTATRRPQMVKHLSRVRATTGSDDS